MTEHPRPVILPDLHLGDDSDDQEAIPRDEQLLRWLLQHPLQRESDLAFALQCHRSTIARQIAALRAQGWVTSVRSSLESSARLWYLLTEAGRRQLTNRGGLSRQTIARLWERMEDEQCTLQVRLPTLGRLQDLVQHVVALLPSLHQEIGEQPTRLRWNWVRFPRDNAGMDEQQAPVGFDALLWWWTREPTQADPVSYALGFLVDPGFTGFLTPLIEQCLTSWLTVPVGGNETGSLPVLIVTPTIQNRDRWRQGLRRRISPDLTQRLRGAIAIWSPDQLTLPPPSAWQDLVELTPCRFMDLLRPLPAVGNSSWMPDTPEKWEKCGMAETTGTREPHPGISPHVGRPRTSSVRVPSEVGARHLRLLEELAVHPLLRIEELAIFLSLEPDTLRHYLTDLGPLVEQVDTVCGRRLRLSARGRRLVCALWMGTSRQSATADSLLQQAGRAILPHVPAIAGLSSFVAGVKQAAPMRGHTLLWWDIGPLDLAIADRRCSTDTFFPVATLVYRLDQSHTLMVWVEWQAESKPVSWHEARIAASHDAIVARARMIQEQGDLSLSPQLLYITVDRHQEMLVWKHVSAFWQETAIPLFTTTMTLLREHGPLASIWRPIWSNTGSMLLQDQRPQRRYWADLLKC